MQFINLKHKLEQIYFLPFPAHFPTCLVLQPLFDVEPWNECTCFKLNILGCSLRFLTQYKEDTLHDPERNKPVNMPLVSARVSLGTFKSVS
jgi:hypothetical protein